MSVSYQILADHGCVVVTWSGEFDEEQLRSMFRELPKHPDLRPGLNRLSDLRGVTFDPSFAEISRFVSQLKPLDNDHGDRKTALLVSGDLSYGMMRVVGALADDFRARILVTREPDEAKEWVGLPSDIVLPTDAQSD